MTSIDDALSADTSAIDTAAAVREGRTTAVEAVTESLARIEARDPAVHAFQLVRHDKALAEAAAFDAEGERTRLMATPAWNVRLITCERIGDTRDFGFCIPLEAAYQAIPELAIHVPMDGHVFLFSRDCTEAETLAFMNLPAVYSEGLEYGIEMYADQSPTRRYGSYDDE